MVMDGGDEAPGTRYVIPGNSPEKERLLKQYKLKKDYYGWTEAVPDSVDLSRVSAVLDVAAGSCAWTLDLARHPAIANRLPAPGDAKGDTVRLYACDIDTRFFTDAPAEDAPDITKFQHDVTKAFPLEMQDTFDLVHMSLLALALTRTGWNSALKNILAILKPGGLLMIDDIDPTLYPEEQRPLAEDVSDASLSSCMDGEGWIPKANRIYTGWVLFSGFIPVLSVQMPRILSEVGFDLVESQRAVGCHGKLCHVIKNPNGRDMTQWTDFSTENMVFVLTHLALALLEKGELRSSDEQKITTANEMKAMLEEIRQGFMHDGAVNHGIYCLAKKPK